MNIKKVVFLNSGGGGNLKFIHEISKIEGKIIVVGVFSDRICEASNFAEKEGIPSYLYKFDRSKNDNGKIITSLNKIKPDVIVTNIHKVLSQEILDQVNSDFINLHYSILPAYKGLIGMKPLKLAEERKNQVFGCTVHEVIPKVDEGLTITQGVFFQGFNKSKNIESMFKCGALCLLNSLIETPIKNNFVQIGQFFISPMRIEKKETYTEVFSKIMK